MAVLASHRRLVNEAILSFGIQPDICQQADDPNLWKLHRGKAQIIVSAQESTNHMGDPVPVLSLLSPLVQLPEDYPQRVELYAFLLEANHQMITASFSLSGGWVVLSSSYYLEELCRTEVMQLLDSLSFHAQSFLRTIEEQFELKP